MNPQPSVPGEALHVPQWNRNHRLLDWPGCSIELSCACGWSSMYPCKLMASRHGNRTFADALSRLRCKQCKESPAELHLVAGHHRTFGSGGPGPDWSLPLRAY